jgi:putative ATP-dependent endonuclease of OLD family
MRVAGIKIENCKSYKEPAEIALDGAFNILVGPNGGGKSNTLDILTITLRHFFLKEYVIHNREQNFAFFRDIDATESFPNIRRSLEPHLDRPSDPVRIVISLVVGESDVANLRALKEHADDFRAALKKFRNTPYPDVSILDELGKLNLLPGTVVDYEILNYSLQLGDAQKAGFQQYLWTINFFLLLAPEIPITDLKPAFAYFSPYRSAHTQDLRANLSAESFQSQLARYANSTSHAPSSLLKLATLYFGDFRRGLELAARDIGFTKAWQSNSVVANVDRYLKTLGYSWDVEVVDRSRNIYELRLTREGRVFSIEQASSGEKEILTFVLGLFALRTSGGLIVIDEPEVHLHPRWQAVLRDLLRELAYDTKNQLLLSTHSPVFINPDTLGFVKRVYMNEVGSTTVASKVASAPEDPKDAWHLLNSHNNERVFFADKVLLVEGIQDRIVFEALLGLFAKELNYRRVIEIVEVHGKNNFETYQRPLGEIGVPHALIADLDYAANIGPPEVATLFVTDYKSIDRRILKNKRSEDRETLAQLIEQAVENDRRDDLKEFWTYVRGRFRSLKENLSEAEKAMLARFLSEREQSSEYVLRLGEIEDYLPPDAASLAGTIRLVRRPELLRWLAATHNRPTTRELLELCLKIMELPAKDWPSAIEQVLSPQTQEAKTFAVGEL